MAKNYADLYASGNDSIALEQRFYAKLEASRGSLIAPTNADFFYTLDGGSIAFAQPFESSPHRSGRHNTGIIKKKKTCSFSFSTYFNIDESLGSPSTAEIDPAIQLLYKSMFGKQDNTGGSPVFTSATPPDLTFSLFEVGDKWSRQARGCFVQGLNLNFPGNGEAKMEWSGAGAESVMIGIGKSITANATNTVTVGSGEGDRFAIGGLVMVIKSDGTTRSTDTPAGLPRRILSIAGDVITLSGANLVDSDGSGSGTPVYLSYYEPSAPVAINNPVTGLVGSMSVASTTVDCFRNVTLALTNNHELVDYCYGMDALSTPFFVPGSRINGQLTVETNLNDEILALFNRVTQFEAENIHLVLGSASGRRFDLTVPKVQFPVPAFSLPTSGSIPISFQGTALQTSLDAADEFTASFL
jgi:hypothetical protein